MVQQTGYGKGCVFVFRIECHQTRVDVFVIAWRIQAPKIGNAGVGLVQAIRCGVAVNNENRLLELPGFVFDQIAQRAEAIAIGAVARSADRFFVIKVEHIRLESDDHRLRGFRRGKALLQPFGVGLIAAIRFVQGIVDVAAQDFPAAIIGAGNMQRGESNRTDAPLRIFDEIALPDKARNILG